MDKKYSGESTSEDEGSKENVSKDEVKSSECSNESENIRSEDKDLGSERIQNNVQEANSDESGGILDVGSTQEANGDEILNHDVQDSNNIGQEQNSIGQSRFRRVGNACVLAIKYTAQSVGNECVLATKYIAQRVDNVWQDSKLQHWCNSKSQRILKIADENVFSPIINSFCFILFMLYLFVLWMTLERRRLLYPRKVKRRRPNNPDLD